MSKARSPVTLFLLSLWAFGTLVLVFVVVLLVAEMLRSGQDPLARMRTANRSEDETTLARPAVSMGRRVITLYFGSPDGRVLNPETREIPLSDSTLENCRSAMQALIAGPESNLLDIVPPTVNVRALFLLDDGELVVNLSREMYTEHTRLKSASLEALFVYGVVNTLTQSALQMDGAPRVRRVRFLFEDSEPEEIFPSHLDMSEPFEAKPEWVEASNPPGTTGPAFAYA